MDQVVTLIPLEQIRDDALMRDRSALDPGPLGELVNSIMIDGLRQPIEVWELAEPDGAFRYGLISGLRRLTAFRELAGGGPGRDFSRIPAFVRRPADIPAAMAAMIAENEVRAEIAPWDKGRLIVDTTLAGIFPTYDAAIAGLYPYVDRQRRSRLRAFALVYDELADSGLATPQRLTVARMERLAAALRGGLAAAIRDCLAEHRGEGLESQWAALGPTLAEAFRDHEATFFQNPSENGRPRRSLYLRQGLMIRREITRNGWILRFTGPEARRGGLIDDVFDLIERWCQPGFKG